LLCCCLAAEKPAANANATTAVQQQISNLLSQYFADLSDQWQLCCCYGHQCYQPGATAASTPTTFFQVSLSWLVNMAYSIYGSI